MVYIKRIELSHFKSFGGTVSVPFFDGFTVISGPNGSGKSNILDALLFCLGLATSKGMRADRLPDLINQKHSSHRNAPEASVSVTFDLSELEQSDDDFKVVEFTSSQASHNGNGHQKTNSNPATSKTENSIESNGINIDAQTPVDNSKEVTVTRRLRVSKGGESYASTYSINGVNCSVSQLHEQLNRLRIYPEGYNVVLQGDVTRIISMNSRERREIIDELAGVAEFDRKIDKTRSTLDSVREREERCGIIGAELQRSLEKLAEDRIKAEKYQKLKHKILEKQQWETVFVWRLLQAQLEALQTKITNGQQEEVNLRSELDILAGQVTQATSELEMLNTQVKALGEDEQLSIASELATQKAKRYQLQQRQQELTTQSQQIIAGIERLEGEIAQYHQTLTQVSQDKERLETVTIPELKLQRDQARKTLETSREKATAIADASDAWGQEQSALSRKVSQLQDALSPQRSEQAQLQERQQQLIDRFTNQTQRLQLITTELDEKQDQREHLSQAIQTGEEQVRSLAIELSAAEADDGLQRDTEQRLLTEQREKQRQLDRLEATRQAQQEAQGTYATKAILQSDLSGVCGLVAQLGNVEPRYQLALEIAAGSRLGHVVVEDDGVAAAGIELLKQNRAGRATFLPLNKISSPYSLQLGALSYARGFVDFAVNLVDCEPKFQKIFAYVFGKTVIFENLAFARAHLGKYRIVTLTGELLESSGAMTGGSKSNRSSLRFGAVNSGESAEATSLRQRLAEIEQILARNRQKGTDKSAHVKQLSQDLIEARQNLRDCNIQQEQCRKDIQRLTQEKTELSQNISRNQQEQQTAESRLVKLSQDIPVIESELQQQQQHLQRLEQSQTSREWQQIQQQIKTEEAALQAREEELRRQENNQQGLGAQMTRLAEKLDEAQQRIAESQEQQSHLKIQAETTVKELEAIAEAIKLSETQLNKLSERLNETKLIRDQAEKQWRALQKQQQEKAWNLEKLQTTQQERQETLKNLQAQQSLQQAELPDPLPDIPFFQETENEITPERLTEQLEKLQQEIRNGQKRLEAMEPVNMLALEEYGKVQERLDELSEKLNTLEAERTELLLRVEHFTTLRLRAFKEAFDAVNENFKTIFASLSDGDGYLQLDDPADPFNGGLNLVAHPKGKPVRRLSSMSGGEKSLTALSFIFSLQRYRPSPFYAFDEVDMFLDGANVEKLSQMIQKQAEQAQFIVVSLRRPMIEASQRTIGVTQARGAHTQVLGIKLH